LAIRAVLFDLGNTLVSYYTSREFPAVLRQCLQECAAVFGSGDAIISEELFERAMALNREQPDYAVRPLEARLSELFDVGRFVDGTSVLPALAAAFMTPIFSMAKRDPAATDVLDRLRSLGIKTAIVSNTPWGSPSDMWRDELDRHDLLARVDAAVFCMDVGRRKPHRAPFDRALSLLGVAPSDALFVGDDHRWDVIGARNAGVRPVLLGQGPAADCAAIQHLGGIVTMATELRDSSGAA
jgi:putative hydrolase of the HAD superfamily